MKIISYLILLTVSFAAFSQNLEYTKKGLKKDGQFVMPKDWVSQFEGNSEAMDLATKGKSAYSTSTVFGFVGGFLIGWPIGTALGGGEPEWAMAAAGAGVIAIAIPIASSSKKKMEEAVRIYNGDPKRETSQLKLNFSGNGIGLAFSF